MRSTLLSVVGLLGLCALVGLGGCPKVNNGSDASVIDGGSSEVAGQGGTSHGGGGKGGSGSGGTVKDGGAANSDAGSTTHDPDAATGPGTDGDAAVGSGTPAVCSTPCAAYQHCELVQVQCIQAPCPPLPECVDNATCGGFAARPCSGLAKCEDDPRDSCDPNHGGADCGGLCVCSGGVFCVQGKVWDAVSCNCVDAAPAGGVTCGKNTCKVGDYCCNASCGTCAPKGAACTQQACL